MEIRYTNHPEDSKHYTADDLRKNYLVSNMFEADKTKLTYSYYDRMICGGVMPVQNIIQLKPESELRAEYFLQRRELGAINIGGDGIIKLDGTTYEIGHKDAIYVGMGVKDVQFQSLDPTTPAKFYLLSTPAHKAYPSIKIGIDDANTYGNGDTVNSNKRIIRQYVLPTTCKTCQLVMGMTELESGNVWNTMPCHTHERRSEVYFYFNIAEDQRVFHLMGQPDETRHIVTANEQALISPMWSIHSGVGTSSYSFVWGMAGENLEYDDMDFLSMDDVK